ncbi:translesion DNA synthesis-associated protein ImuA [Variovorax sp. KK3]|uniref:translesion DNA synthesis-associated protein ImuA n=1 Tax=Variovorax sp. KK3 TaxID=1855728 RepID=UPI00097C1281|nr:translesion DNA synthesis-associated protein ImuA [Variovorax sp. KK3]
MALPSFDTFSAAARHKLWSGDALGRADGQVIGTGHAALDAELPGGGWPVGAMTELLQAEPEAHAWQLLLPALARAVEERSGPVVLVGAPQEPFGPALASQGLPVESLLWVRCEAASARLWACEQALRCADVTAVLAWLPQARVGELRRLQLAAAQHEALLFVLRPDTMAQASSPARLRLQLQRCEEDATQLDVHVLKRRGPPLAKPLQLPARHARMNALLAAGRLRRQWQRQQDVAAELPVGRGATVVRLSPRQPSPPNGEKGHALDRAALAA